MTRTTRAVLLAVAGLAAAAVASAQEAVSSLVELADRTEVGQRIWVTDTTGREVGGRLERISSDGIVLKARGLETFAASDIHRVRARDRDSLKSGTLIGLGIGLGMGTAWCIGAVADDSGEIDARVECGEGFTVFPAVGALIGLAVDAVIPGRIRLVYQASLPQEGSPVRLNIVPVFSTYTKGVAVSFVF